MPGDIKRDDVGWLSTYIVVADMNKAIGFYCGVLGFILGDTMKNDQGVPMHAEFLYQGSVFLMATYEGAWGGTHKAPATSGVDMPNNFYLYVPDVDAVFAKAKAAGAEVLTSPEDSFWGDRTAMIQDPDGYKWMIARKLSDRDMASASAPLDS